MAVGIVNGLGGLARSISAASVVALAALPGSLAEASPLDLFGFGGRSSGLGGNGVASSSDFSALYTNPAGLARVAGTELVLGGLLGSLTLEIDDRDTDPDPATGSIFGAAARLQLGGILRDRVSLGIGGYVPTNVLVQARAPLTGDPTFAVLGSRTQAVGLLFGLGFAVNERLRLGISVLTLAGLEGEIFVSADAGGKFTATSEQALIARAAPIAGVQYSVPEWALELGLVVRAESDATFDVRVDNDLINELPLTIPPVDIGGTAQFDPLTVSVEASWTPRARLSTALQVAYYRWSEFTSPTINPVMGMPPPAAPDFSDTVVPRLSAEWRALAKETVLDLRGGYSFVMSPAPEMSGQQSLLDNHRHVLATGIGLAWPSVLPVRVDVWVQGHLLVDRSHEKNPNLFPDPDTMPFDRIDTGGHVIVGGLTLGVEL